jgi:uncharacterized repeat protein (TIGR01451 family)
MKAQGGGLPRQPQVNRRRAGGIGSGSRRGRYVIVALLALTVGAVFSVFTASAHTSKKTGSSFVATRQLAAGDSCGYPSGSTGRPAADFNESTVLRDFSTSGSGTATQIAAWYSDEHALTLGVNPDPDGTPVTAMTASPTDHATNPDIGDISAADASGRPLYPALFITDVTNGASNSGDWQQQSDNSGAQSPSDVFGTWKAATKSGGSITPDADPASNSDFGTSADTPPASITYERFRTEARWNASDLTAGGAALQPGHTYRVQFMVHDGDQNKTGGDVGEACTNITIPLARPTVTTSAVANATIGAGGTAGIHDTATLSNGTSNAAGTLNFKLYNSTCTTVVGTASASVSGANAGQQYASAPDINVGPGTYHWTVSYTGDAGNLAIAETACGTVAGENSVVNPRQPTVTTVADTNVAITASGADLTDTATLSGGTSSAGGTLTFHLFADNGSGGCGTEVTGSPVTKAVSAADGVNYTSPTVHVPALGDYHWRVSYDGDANNLSIPLTACGQVADHELSRVVKASSTLTTNAGSSKSLANGPVALSDSATLSGGTSDATGTITFTLYADDGSGGCGTQLGTNQKTVAGADGKMYNSSSITVSTPGTYHWIANYGGDAKNAATSNGCNEANENVRVANPQIAIVKSPKSQTINSGHTADFAITVTNTGDVDLTDVTVTDPNSPSCDKAIGPLAHGASTNYTCTSPTLTANLHNVATVTGKAGSDTVTASDFADVVVKHPSIDIEKTPDTQTINSGNTADFTITVTNTGDVDLTDVAVTDPNSPGCDHVIGALAQGASTHYVCTSPVLTANLHNVATVTGKAGNDTVTDDDSADVTVVHPKIDIEKTPDFQTITSGTGAVFTITVTNTGDVDLTNVTVTDPLSPNCNKSIGPLAQGASATYSCTSPTLTADLLNVASVTGKSGNETVTDSDDAHVTVVAPPFTPPPPPTPHPGIAILKNPKSQTVASGATATFNITVTNTGDVTLTNVTVVDLIAPDCNRSIGTMAPGATVTYSCKLANVTSSLMNVAVATGTGGGTTVTASDNAPVTAAPFTPAKKKAKKHKVVSHRKPKATG